MNNLIFKGTVRHRRYTPFNQAFKYNTFMTYFDISRVESLLPNSFLFKVNKPGLVSYYRSDYHGDTKLTLDESVRKTVKEKTGTTLEGPIRLLTHLRYFGYYFNPVSFYYCFDKSDEKLEMIMAEVTNTPWNERHCYFITAKKINLFDKG